MNIKYLIELGLFEFKRPLVATCSYLDSRRFLRNIPNYKSFSNSLSFNKNNLLPFYNNYVSNISSFNQAISLELAAFLLTFCQFKKPQTIADLGSGFSSFVFRYFIKMSKLKIHIWSIDDHNYWLKKTAGFLRCYKMPLEHLVTWNNFRKFKLTNFDLVLYDLGNMKTRIKCLPLVTPLSKKNKYLILDDMHFPVFEPKARKIVVNAGFTLYNLRYFTKDSIGRFADLAIRNR